MLMNVVAANRTVKSIGMCVFVVCVCGGGGGGDREGAGVS